MGTPRIVVAAGGQRVVAADAAAGPDAAGPAAAGSGATAAPSVDEGGRRERPARDREEADDEALGHQMVECRRHRWKATRAHTGLH
jgi:hypothetical protein